MTTSKLSMMIIAALLLLASSSPALGFAAPPASSSSRSCSQELRSISQITSKYQKVPAVSLTIQRMASNDEEPEKGGDAATDDITMSSKHVSSEAATAAGGGTIAITSAKSAADAATNTSSSTTINKSSSPSPSTTGFSLILLPTLLFKFTIVLIVKFATDVVVYPVLFLWRWARLGKKKIGRGLARMFGKNNKEGINGTTVVNGDSVGEFQ